jgi:hypothetical protein
MVNMPYMDDYDISEKLLEYPKILSQKWVAGSNRDVVHMGSRLFDIPTDIRDELIDLQNFLHKVYLGSRQDTDYWIAKRSENF